MRVIDLSGPDGNAYALLAMAASWSRQLGWSEKQSNDLQANMKSGDYHQLLAEFERSFATCGVSFLNDPRKGES
jgi:GH24 family phage-related lysozyme (muramidase)